MVEVFSDELNLKVGDLLSRPLSPRHPPTKRASGARYTRTPACLRARPFTPVRPLHARTRCCLREILFKLAPASRAHPLFLARRQCLYARCVCALVNVLEFLACARCP